MAAKHFPTPAELAEMEREARSTECSLTPVKREGSSSLAVHLGWDGGSYDTYPLCGALKGHDTETTDEPANCGLCARVVRLIGLAYLLKDEDGWTGLYEPRRAY